MRMKPILRQDGTCETPARVGAFGKKRVCHQKFRDCIHKALMLSISFAASALNMGSAQHQLIFSAAPSAPDSNQIPKTWDDDALRTFEVPLADPDYSPVQVPASFYYQIPERPIYKSYPVYAPGREPRGYWERLTSTPPEVVWGRDENGVEHRPLLRTKADWVRAGELVFEAGISYSDGPGFLPSLANVRDPKYYEALHPPLSANGVLPFGNYVIRKQGKVEFSQLSCAACHTRVLPDGTVIKGAPTNLAFDRSVTYNAPYFKKLSPDAQKATLTRLASAFHTNYGAPWLHPDPADAYGEMTFEKLAQMAGATPPGVIPRGGTSVLYPPQVPDLIGIKDRFYLDHTGLERHRGPGDLMRYAALNQGMNMWGRYGTWIPAAEDGKLPPPASLSRYSDEQLYALSLFLYSLQPPPNPNKFGELAAYGQKVFNKSGCAGCHAPPLYTNNKLTLAKGFQLPTDTHGDRVTPITVGTDSRLALQTRRGTGYYKVPSLKGVWYRGPFEHGGSVAKLEDWFDPARLRDDYVPTGFVGYNVKHRSVQGHEFGLNLSAEERRALIAFLRTL